MPEIENGSVASADLAIVIPTRNRPQLAIQSLKSVLEADDRGVGIIVSDNSTNPEDQKSLAAFCRPLDALRVAYIRTPQSFSMSAHWQWALTQARTLSDATHFMYLTDRSRFWPLGLRRLHAISRSFPHQVLSGPFDATYGRAGDTLLEQGRWSGRLFEIDSDYLLDLASRAVFPVCTPNFRNSIVPRAVVEQVEARFGTVFDSISPDYCFAYRCLATVEHILFYDRPTFVMTGSEQSAGHSIRRGVLAGGGADLHSKLTQASVSSARPRPEFTLIPDFILYEYQLVAQSVSGGFRRIDMTAYLRSIADAIEQIEDPALAAKNRALLLRSGGTPVPRGWAGRRRRLLIALRREPFRLIRVAAVRLIANSRTQPLWRTLGRVGICPPASRWFRFNSVSEALLWGAHFPRRRSPGLGHMWLYFHPRRVRVCRMSPAGLDDGTRGHAEGAKGPGGSPLS